MEEIFGRARPLESTSRSDDGNTFTKYGGNMYEKTGPNAQMFKVLDHSSYDDYANCDHHHYNEGINLVEKFARSLRYPEIRSRLYEIKYHEEKTFEWIFKMQNIGDQGGPSIPKTNAADRQPTSNIAEWFWCGEGVYLILGEPGSGKSTLMKFLYQDQRIHGLLRSWANGKDAHVLFHSFWGMSNESATRSWKGLLAHLISQLVSLEPQNITGIANKNRHKTEYSDWSEEELEMILMAIIHSSRTKYCLLIDALDEVETTEHILDILRLIDGLSSQKGSNCKICLATRPIPYTDMLNPIDIMDIHKYTEADLIMFVNSTLRRSEALQHHLRDPQTEIELRRLKAAIWIKAQGVWIWAYNVLKRVEDLLLMERDLREIRASVNKFPELLDEL